MLVLTRKVDEAILIRSPDFTVKVVIVRIDDSQVRVGIEAPDGVNIVRAELLERHQEHVQTA